MSAYLDQGSELWDESQRAYRFGVILILPPEPIRSQVNALRAKHDPVSHACCDAHISLTVPLAREPSDSDWKELNLIVSTISPITVHYGPLTSYLPHPGVVLDIAPQALLDSLRARLETCAAFVEAAPRRYRFRAHMTIAEFISVERTKELLIELEPGAPSGSFLCDRVSYLVPNSNFRFIERGTLLLHG
jgi:2'-5' RNA ligase